MSEYAYDDEFTENDLSDALRGIVQDVIAEQLGPVYEVLGYDEPDQGRIDWETQEARWAAEEAQLAAEEAAALESDVLAETELELLHAAGQKAGINDTAQLLEMYALACGVIELPEFLRQHPGAGPTQVEAALARAAELVKPSQEGDEVAAAKRYMERRAATDAVRDFATRQALDWPRDKAEEDELNRGLEATAIVGDFDREAVAEVRETYGLPEPE